MIGASILAPLDLSTAFGTINNGILDWCGGWAWTAQCFAGSPPSFPRRASIDRRGEVQPAAFIMWDAADFSTFSSLIEYLH